MLALCASAAVSADAPFKVIANPDVPLDGMSRAQLSDVFLKRTTVWPGGARIEPVDLAEGSSAFEAFCGAIHGKAASVILAFSRRVTLSGRETPPHVRASDEEVMSFVRSKPGAIGYVSAGASTSGVRVIKIGN